MRILVCVASILGLAAVGCFADARPNPIEDVDESVRSANGRGDDAYQACDGDQTRCREPNSACARYASDTATSFCAPVCETDGDCPTIAGFEAACNFAFCALLCDDGVCPDGMTCLAGSEFIDSTGEKRGAKDVCVTAP